ncbi:MAG: hypothetical protein ACFBWO_08800 [Paracoccaceae bacterium]
MAWALRGPSTFGQFFPEGDYLGYRDLLESEFDKLPPVEKEKYNNRFVSYKRAISEKFAINRGRLMEFEQPKVFHMEAAYKNLASLIMPTNRLFAVDEALKGIVEALEPGIHQFWKLEIQKKRRPAMANQLLWIRDKEIKR